MKFAPIDIRHALPSDIEAMIVLLEQLFGIEGDFRFDASIHRRGLESLLARPDEAWAWVAVKDEHVVGMCTGQKLVSTAAGGLSLQIEDMVIDAAYRTRGIGTALFNHIEHWARQQGFVRMQLNAVHDNTPALTFYQKQGWEQCQLVWLRKHLNSGQDIIQ